MSWKKRLLLAAMSFPLLLIVLLTWGLIEPYTLDNEEEEAIIPNLPSSWEGKKIAQLSDFQVGMWWDNVNTIDESVEKIIAEKPVAVLISGDFIYHAAPDGKAEIEEVVDLIRPLAEMNIPVYAVLGNHDYGIRNKNTQPKPNLANKLERALEEAGIMVLKNEAIALELNNVTDGEDDANLYLVGIGSHWAKNDRVNEALAQVPQDRPRIVLMHNPDSFEAFPANTAPFSVAGHTHGGQIRLPNSPQWSWLALTKEDKVVADGWAKGYGAAGNNLYVNRGIGFSDIPIRINCAPEITFFTLRSQAE